MTRRSPMTDTRPCGVTVWKGGSDARCEGCEHQLVFVDHLECALRPPQTVRPPRKSV